MRRLFLLVLCMLGFWASEIKLSGQPSRREREARAVVEEFFKAYGRKDLDGLFKLFHPNSPDLAPLKDGLAKTFADTGPLTIKELTYERVKVRGDTAWVDLGVTIEGVETKTGKPFPAFGCLLRTLEMVREESVWKVQRYEDSVYYYPDLFLLLEDPAERKQFLIDHRERLFTVTELLNPGVVSGWKSKDLAETLKVSDRVREIAEFLDSDVERVAAGGRRVCRSARLVQASDRVAGEEAWGQ
jgi:hypothetical protein